MERRRSIISAYQLPFGQPFARVELKATLNVQATLITSTADQEMDVENQNSSSNSDLETFSQSDQLHNSSEVITESPYSLNGIKLIPEGEWGWAVCASGFVIQFIILGVHNSFGILFAFLLDEFGKSKAATAWVGSAAVGILYLFGPITCGLNERIGFRTIACIGGMLCGLGMFLTSFVTELHKIYVTYSLLWGIGSSLCYFSTLSVPGEYFCQRLSLVNGIITAGSGFGTLTFGPLLDYLLKNYGLTTTLRVLSAIMCVLVLASLTFKRFRSPLEQLYDIKRTPAPFCGMAVWKNKAFVLYTAAVSLFMLGYFIPYVHVVSLVGDLGISASDGAMLIGYMSISSTLSRILFGKLSDHPQVNRLYMTQFAIVGFGVTTMLCPIVKTYPGFIAVMTMLGLFDGMYVVLIAVVVTDIVGVHKLNQALGNLYGVISFAITAGPPFAGFVYDALLSYNTAFYICGATTILSSLLMFLIPWLTHRDVGRRFERDSIDSRLESLIHSANTDKRQNDSEKTTTSGVSGTKSGLTDHDRRKKRTTGCSEKEKMKHHPEYSGLANDGSDNNECTKTLCTKSGQKTNKGRKQKTNDQESTTLIYSDNSQYNYFDNDIEISDSICTASFNTSKDTSYNSSNRGSITKVLLARQFDSTSTSSHGSSPEQQAMFSKCFSPLNSIKSCKAIQETSTTRETIV